MKPSEQLIYLITGTWLGTEIGSWLQTQFQINAVPFWEFWPILCLAVLLGGLYFDLRQENSDLKRHLAQAVRAALAAEQDQPMRPSETDDPKLFC